MNELFEMKKETIELLYCLISENQETIAIFLKNFHAYEDFCNAQSNGIKKTYDENILKVFTHIFNVLDGQMEINKKLISLLEIK